MASKAKYAIIDAFLKLAETEDYEKITVTSLVEECKISRQTFYYHFNDIEEMLTFAFEKETEKICEYQANGSWHESAELYVDFLSKYDILIRKASASSKFMFIYNLVYNSFFEYIAAYLEKKGKKPLASEESKFVVSCAASSFCGLVMLEIQKEKSDYEKLLNKITAGFNVDKTVIV